jgi:hypothetical protein
LSRGAAEQGADASAQVRVAGLLRKLLRDFRQRSVNDLPPVLQNQNVRADFLHQMQQVRTDDNGRAVARPRPAVLRDVRSSDRQVYDRRPGGHDRNAGFPRGAAMDALSDVLRLAQLAGGVFLHAEFSEPWCLAIRLGPEQCAPLLASASQLIPYHYVVEGQLHVRVEGEPAFVLGPRDVVLFPRNDPHLMGSDLDLPPVMARDVIQPPKDGGLFSIGMGGGGARARLVCGFLGCDGARANPVISMLPAAMRLTLDDGGVADWIGSTFQLAAGELASSRPGSEAVLAKVSELLFVEAVRRYAEALPEGQTGWLAGLRDPYVARALALLHRDPGGSWTVDQLGREVGLSRSALAERFTHLAGAAPMQYLTNWRA